MEISLEGKRVFISGAAEGIGRATALSMHKLGAEAVSYTHLTLPTNREV